MSQLEGPLTPGLARTMTWANRWRLPANDEAYRTLALRKAPTRTIETALRPIAALMASAKQKRIVGRTWSILIQHAPEFEHSATVPFVTLGTSFLFPNHALYHFESTLWFLVNVAYSWLFSNMVPQELTSVISDCIHASMPQTSLGRSALQILDISTYVTTSVIGCFTTLFSEVNWVRIFDFVLSSADSANAFLRVVVATFVARALHAVKTNSRAQAVIDCFYRRSDDGELTTSILNKALTISIRFPFRVAADLPARQNYYPTLQALVDKYPSQFDAAGRLSETEVAFVVPDVKATLRELSQNELALHRRWNNEKNFREQAESAKAWQCSLGLRDHLEVHSFTHRQREAIQISPEDGTETKVGPESLATPAPRSAVSAEGATGASEESAKPTNAFRESPTPSATLLRAWTLKTPTSIHSEVDGDAACPKANSNFFSDAIPPLDRSEDPLPLDVRELPSASIAYSSSWPALTRPPSSSRHQATGSSLPTAGRSVSTITNN